MNKKSLFGQKLDLRRVHYDFQNPPRKTQSHQILAVLRKMDIIKFSDSSGNVLIKSRRFEEDRYYSVFSVFGDLYVNFKYNINKNSIRKKLRIFFSKKVFKRAEVS